MKTVTHTVCGAILYLIYIGSGTASSFSFNIYENPASNCALFVNKSVVKRSEQRTLLTRSDTLLQIKFMK